jgi:hypothetical protein
MPTPGDRLDLAIDEAARILTEGQQGGSVAVLADMVNTDPPMLKMLQAETAVPIQFLVLNSSRSSPDQTLLSAVDNFITQLFNFRFHFSNFIFHVCHS